MTTTSRAGRLLVAVRADDGRLVAEHGAHLVDVERLALRQALLDVDEDDVGVVALASTCAHVAPTFPAPTTVTFVALMR